MEIPGFQFNPEKLKCMNCKSAPGTAEWGKVFVCQACKDFADRVFTRLQVQIKQLETLGFESIRLALVKSELHASEYKEQVEVSKEDLLKSVVNLVKGHRAGGTDQRGQHRVLVGANEVVLELEEGNDVGTLRSRLYTC